MMTSGINRNPSPWLRRFAKLTCYSTLFLIFAGAMVKSTGSGLSVPDWPLSYGMVFPPMIGGVFYEHGHRMVATVVGFFMLCLAIWLAVAEQRRWVKVLGFCALGTVIAQGILGGITVLFFLPTPISVFHGLLAQTFFILTIIIAYSLSKEHQMRPQKGVDVQPAFLKMTMVWIILIFIQLILGAVMRHTESGLAIPDFPTMGGQWIPAFNDQMLALINDWRFEHNYDFVTQTQVVYHFAHRFGALLVAAGLVWLNFCAWQFYRTNRSVLQTLFYINVMVILQIILGVLTVLTEKAPQLTSVHVVTGAAILGLSVLLYLRVAPLSLDKISRTSLQ